MKNYSSLEQHFNKIANFNHLAAITGWDQAAMMPAGGNASRGDALAELSLHIHKLTTAPEIEEWLNRAESEQLSPIQHANLREIRRQWLHANVLPSDLVKAKSLAGTICEHAWRTQRQNNDWDGFSGNFEEVVNLSCQEAEIRAEALNLSPYDAMLDLYEPGMNTNKLDTLFGDLSQWLPKLIQDVTDKQAADSAPSPVGHFNIETQAEVGQQIMSLLGFDFNHGRLDVSSHPFCGGVPTDVRITTRYQNDECMQSLMGVIHETGHARYEQGLPKGLAGQPAGEARSMGIHESQSLFFEMQLGRSHAFAEQLTPILTAAFNDHNPLFFAANNLARTNTQVKPGFIRVDADEVTYPAHVILRYEIERDLMNKKISYKDIPELWDNAMQKWLGLSTKGNFKDGCMQDIHWTDGSFGYFPSYTLGAMYAAQFMAAMRKTIDVDSIVRSGDMTPIFTWLQQHIWSKGSTLTTDQLVSNATGSTLDSSFFKQHLKRRYL